MTRKLYDLCGARPDWRFSPFCWLAKFALAHKELEHEIIPLRFTEKENYPDPEHGKLPILVDGDTVVTESWEIVRYLDRTYPERPLAATAGEWAAAEFYRAWLGAAVFPALAPFMMIRVHAVIDDGDKDYFRASREKRFGATLEDLAERGPKGKSMIETALATLAAPLSEYDFLGGAAPNLCDYVVFSPFMWQRCVTAETFYETPAPAAAWMERMLAACEGLAGSAARAAA
ncbi:MAG: glutathione S-transferase N-terminal domain-containing protein [Parvularculaceae bacterium]